MRKIIASALHMQAGNAMRALSNESHNAERIDLL